MCWEIYFSERETFTSRNVLQHTHTPFVYGCMTSSILDTKKRSGCGRRQADFFVVSVCDNKSNNSTTATTIHGNNDNQKTFDGSNKFNSRKKNIYEWKFNFRKWCNSMICTKWYLDMVSILLSSVSVGHETPTKWKVHREKHTLKWWLHERNGRDKSVQQYCCYELTSECKSQINKLWNAFSFMASIYTVCTRYLLPSTTFLPFICKINQIWEFFECKMQYLMLTISKEEDRVTFSVEIKSHVKNCTLESLRNSLN